MEFITRPIERRLWPRGYRSAAPTPHWLVAARFAYALLRDFLHGDLTSARDEPRLHDDVRDRAAARVRVLRVERPRRPPRSRARSCKGFLAPLGPRSAELSDQIIGFVDNVSGSLLGDHRHRAAAVLAVDDGAKGREQLQLRLARRPSAQLRAPVQRVSGVPARRAVGHERRDRLHGHAREHDGHDAAARDRRDRARCSTR